MAANHWLGGTGGSPNDWNTAANWSLAHVPLAGEDVVLANSAYAINPVDVSATLLGNVYVGKGMARIGTYNAGTPQYLILGCQSGKKITIHGDQKGAECWLHYTSTNAVNVDIAGWGEVDDDEMESLGIHLKQNGAAAISRIVNSGGAVSCEGGTMSTIECGAGNTVVKSGVSNFNFRSYNQLAFATIHEMPTTSLTVSDGQVTVESDTAIQALTQTGGTIVWNGGADINTLTVFKGYFDAGNARKKPTIGSARFLGVAHETIINLRNGVGGATFTDYEIHGTPTMLLPEGFKLQPAA